METSPHRPTITPALVLYYPTFASYTQVAIYRSQFTYFGLWEETRAPRENSWSHRENVPTSCRQHPQSGSNPGPWHCKATALPLRYWYLLNPTSGFISPCAIIKTKLWWVRKDHKTAQNNFMQTLILTEREYFNMDNIVAQTLASCP